MKMSNYFLGDAYAYGRKLGDDRCDEFMLAVFEDSTECAASAHAINNHDALVEALGSAIHELMFLAEFYNKAQRSNVTSDQLDPPEVYDYQSIHEYIQAWKKAKGES